MKWEKVGTCTEYWIGISNMYVNTFFFFYLDIDREIKYESKRCLCFISLAACYDRNKKVFK